MGLVEFGEAPIKKQISVYWYKNKLAYSYEVNGIFIHESIEWKGDAGDERFNQS